MSDHPIETGDYVQHPVHGRGVVVGIVNACALVMPIDLVPKSVANPHGANVPFRQWWASALAVPVVNLLHRLNGWRWSPHNARPQVGDIICTDLAKRQGFVPTAAQATHFLLMGQCTEFATQKDWWNALPSYDGGLTYTETPTILTDGFIAKAIAGIDGWSWLPAIWAPPSKESP